MHNRRGLGDSSLMILAHRYCMDTGTGRAWVYKIAFYHVLLEEFCLLHWVEMQAGSLFCIHS